SRTETGRFFAPETFPEATLATLRCCRNRASSRIGCPRRRNEPNEPLGRPPTRRPPNPNHPRAPIRSERPLLPTIARTALLFGWHLLQRYYPFRATREHQETREVTCT